MVNWERCIAGIGLIAGSLALIIGGVTHADPETMKWLVSLGITPLTTLVGFFIGERNGERKTEE